MDGEGPYDVDTEEEEKEKEKKEEEEQQVEKKKEEQKKGKEKKGNWKFIGHEPMNYELHPCIERWRKIHPKGPCMQYKQIRWVVVPLSDRLKQLAMPLLRRLLALWLEFGDKMSPEMKSRLLKFLVENYGLSAEFLEQILEEAVRAREKGTEVKEKKKKKPRKKAKKKKTKKKKTKKKKDKKGKAKKEKKAKKKKKEKKDKPGKEKKEKPEKKEKESGLVFKRRKAGKLPLDWPYKMGSKLLLTCISYLSRDPDEDYNSRASEYFDVQSMTILELFCYLFEINLPDPDRPTQYGEALVIMALNLSDWIAKFITTPAQNIPDSKVEEYLALRGVRPKKPKPAKPKPGDSKAKKRKKESVEHIEVVEPVTEVQRHWEEHKAPVYVPEKSRISKRKPHEEWETDEEGNPSKSEMWKEQKPDNYELAQFGEEQDKFRTVGEVKQDFLEYINWYNPWEPEFMYFGPRETPDGVYIFKIWDPDTDEVPSDLRALNWNQVEYGFKDNYSLIPSPVPQYYPALRPLRPLRFEDFENSGVPREIMKKNLRLYSPWYLMRKPLKPVPPPPPPPPVPPRPPEDGYLTMEEYGEFELELQMAADIEEVIEDEMLEATKEPSVQDSLWGDYVMKEQLDILGHLLYLMVSIPDLTLEYVFETLEEFCEAVECAERDENPTPENKILIDKRTIILEQYFLDFFGKKFRDYNERTPHYMRVICRRCAYYVQLLYECTARILWEFQSQANPPTPIPSRPETPDDPDALRDWDEWLAWLLKVTKTCDEWAGWISETVTEAERKAAKKKNEFVGPDGRKVPLTEEEWFGWKSQVEQKVLEYRSSKKKIYQESPYYLEKAKHILPVKHRQKICQWVSESYGEGGGESERQSDAMRENDSDDDTEWEDLSEREVEEEYI